MELSSAQRRHFTWNFDWEKNEKCRVAPFVTNMPIVAMKAIRFSRANQHVNHFPSDNV
jgi:hypothetical protein